MALGREPVEQDYVIEQVRERFRCRVLWSEGRPCLEYETEDELGRIAEYVRAHFDTELLDVFFTAIESLSEES